MKRQYPDIHETHNYALPIVYHGFTVDDDYDDDDERDDDDDDVYRPLDQLS